MQHRNGTAVKQWSGCPVQVYKGLRSGVQDVAIKVLTYSEELLMQQFWVEIELMKQLSFDGNIVQFYGCVIDTLNPILVYPSPEEVHPLLKPLHLRNQAQCLDVMLADQTKEVFNTAPRNAGFAKAFRILCRTERQTGICTSLAQVIVTLACLDSQSICSAIICLFSSPEGHYFRPKSIILGLYKISPD